MFYSVCSFDFFSSFACACFPWTYDFFFYVAEAILYENNNYCLCAKLLIANIYFFSWYVRALRLLLKVNARANGFLVFISFFSSLFFASNKIYLFNREKKKHNKSHKLEIAIENNKWNKLYFHSAEHTLCVCYFKKKSFSAHKKNGSCNDHRIRARFIRAGSVKHAFLSFFMFCAILAG